MTSVISKSQVVEFLNAKCKTTAAHVIDGIKNVVFLKEIEGEFIFIHDMCNLLTKSLTDDIECNITQIMVDENQLISEINLYINK
jgi:hypothetical protein